MKEIRKSIIYPILIQILLWSIFIFIDETLYNLSIVKYQGSAEEIAFVYAIASSLILLIIYFLKEKKFNKIFNTKRKNNTFITVWLFTTIFISGTLLHLVDIKLIHICINNGFMFSCFLNGIEYAFYGLLLIVVLLIILLVRFIKYVIKRMREKRNES